MKLTGWFSQDKITDNSKVQTTDTQNIYPRLTAENYLVDWMETTVSGTGEPADPDIGSGTDDSRGGSLQRRE